MESDDYEMFKIVVIGSSSIGKSNIALRFAKGEYKDTTKTTIGVEFFHKIITLNDTKVKVTLWDTAGQEVYRSLSKVYYKGALGIILVYDVTNQKSYLDVEQWYKLANDNLNLNNVATMVLGNKIDLIQQKVVPFQRVLKDYKQKLGIQCFQVSAMTGEGIQQSILYLIEKIYNMYVKKQDQNTSNDDDNYVQQSSEGKVEHGVSRKTYIRGTIKPQYQTQKQNEMEASKRMQKSAMSNIRGSKLQQFSKPAPKKKCAC